MDERAQAGQGDGALPLSGVRVVDLTRVMTGPYCTLMLGDLGADVVKVEQPGKGDDTRSWGPPFVGDQSAYFLSINRNKRSIALDLKHEAGRAALWRLIEGADVVVENFSPGTVDRLGFGYAAVRARKPDVVYASISGFGQTGPARHRTAYDLILQGMGGIMSVTGQPDGEPTKVGVPIADIGAGMFAAFAIVGALYRRERTGAGERIDGSMLAGQIALLTYQAGIWFSTGRVPGRLGNAHPIVAPYDTYRTADGYVNVAVGNDGLWRRFCAAFDRPDLAEDPDYRTNAGRITNLTRLNAAIGPILERYSTAEVVERLDAQGIPCGPIYDMAQVFSDPQTLDQELVREVPHPTLGTVKLTGFPYRLDQAPLQIRHHPPLLGEHTAQILREAGYSEAEIAALFETGAAQ
jgi:crotonobetainyl-CoA:carnitine CoA-transferase CaiB-like acyl-CoA transferase